MIQQQLPGRWIEDATWLVQAIDPRSRLIRLVRMNEASYRTASFLDDRMLRPGLETRLCSLDQALSEATSLRREDARWIFHIGHVGSTLVSRLLGELGGVLSIREPRSLRDLAFADHDEQPRLARELRRLFSRSFARDQVALVKATSAVSEQASLLVPPGGAALFLYASPENYIAGILAGENSLNEVVTLHEHRLARLRRRGIDLVGFESATALRAAAAWACEMTSLEGASVAMGDRRILWADFDVMLGDMAEWVERCARHFDFEISRQRADELVAGPLMRRYSKALEYDYNPALRAELLAEAAQRKQAEIRTALNALQEAGKSAPLLERALNRAQQES